MYYISTYSAKRKLFQVLSLLVCHKKQLSTQAFEISKSLLTKTENKVFVVSTCSRGIGLEFTKQLIEKTSPSSTIIGLYRTKTSKLQEMETQYDKLKLIHVNLDSTESIIQCSNEIKSFVSKIDLLLNTAAILGDSKNQPGPERSLKDIDINWLEKSFRTNLFGHILMTQQLAPLMKHPSSISDNDIPNDCSRIVNLSARVGSISDNSLGGWYSYRMSKAALNMFTKTSSIELKRYKCIVISIHPGTTNTDLSLPFQKNVKPEKLFPVEYSVSSMLNVIWQTQLKDTGKFYAYDGTEIPY